MQQVVPRRAITLRFMGLHWHFRSACHEIGAHSSVRIPQSFATLQTVFQRNLLPT
eukprot:c30056_g1_i1 orf=1-162(-)